MDYAEVTSPTIKLDRLLYTHYQHPNLEAAYNFYTDFGLYVAERSDNVIYFRGFGEDPYIFVAEKSPDSSKHFVGSGWLLQSQADFDAASRLPGASTIQKSTAPGGGNFVDVKDPLGFNMRLLHGIAFRQKEEQRQEKPKPVIFNSWEDKPRKGEFQRFDGGPSKVFKLGHFGFVVDQSQYESTVAWYLNTFGFARSDTLYDSRSGKDIMVFMHIDKGEQFVDHHSIFIQTSPHPLKTAYPHHSSFEVDNIDTQLLGHYHLEDKGWTNCWGIGRHLLGSQIFDYWFDSSGNVVEHYSDGDVVNNRTPAPRLAATPNSIAIWGPNVSLAFLTGRIEDAKKELPKLSTGNGVVAA
ncbi:uncharacterized protein Z520_03651 [Fonsecaea multimorphosa CBS 102226]|uniref:VOC domain-containing protein n=1 Tax=Fonsecaea multimorphosa CBS 102226 TaxID=1442371 RepID=A0A0D2KCT3_9EURO|nr:uncharacterized protein Z520_03651 [Fonsecaea multimorphosa CBS 102226]KIY00985.1 hypothetical protein Z520_03651 [Fonsecaea multimorphosa CBS 102226]OAL27570.1 hypothetical protein AYO22_03474 [Fonsecaea multimorphosa]